MPYWKRIGFTVIAIVSLSVSLGLLWSHIFGFELPSYIAGVLGGLIAVPVWEFLKTVGQKKK